jgi:ribonuclease VapC
MTFVDAAAIVAVLGAEAESERCGAAIDAASEPFTSAIAVWEAILALARADKIGKLDLAEMAVHQFLEDRGIELRQLPPPTETIELSTEAARKYRSRRGHLNLADCFHYACAKHYGASILSTANEFRFTDLDVIP